MLPCQLICLISHTLACMHFLPPTQTSNHPSSCVHVQALIIPVVHRGLRERSGDVKKRAARIVGNLCSLINDSKDMAPYVPLLLPELQVREGAVGTRGPMQAVIDFPLSYKAPFALPRPIDQNNALHPNWEAALRQSSFCAACRTGAS